MTPAVLAVDVAWASLLFLVVVVLAIALALVTERPHRVDREAGVPAARRDGPAFYLHVAALCLLAFVAWLMWAPQPHSTFTHAEKGRCPSGGDFVPDMFKKNGKPGAGCFDPNGDGSIDVLYPGESIELNMDFQKHYRRMR